MHDNINILNSQHVQCENQRHVHTWTLHDVALFIFLAGENVQGYKLDCSATAKTSTCNIAATLTKGPLLAGDITDFLVKGAYMFATRDNQVCYWIVKLFIVMVKVRVMVRVMGKIWGKNIFEKKFFPMKISIT